MENVMKILMEKYLRLLFPSKALICFARYYAQNIKSLFTIPRSRNKTTTLNTETTKSCNSTN